MAEGTLDFPLSTALKPLLPGLSKARLSCLHTHERLLTAIAAGLFIRFATLESEREAAVGEGLPDVPCAPGLSKLGLRDPKGSDLEAAVWELAGVVGWVLFGLSAAGFGAPKGRIGLEGYFGCMPFCGDGCK